MDVSEGRNLEAEDDQSLGNASMSQSNWYQAQMNEKKAIIDELRQKVKQEEDIINQINSS